ncbi:MAG: thiol-disulfide isomerase/thioredoxin [Halioglobus sp.]|jgi:thiol-disulfide isomerase/thioredoxin
MNTFGPRMKALLIICLSLGLLACNTAEKPPSGINIKQFQGQWLVINYWAQWCKPCIEEIPELNALDQKFEQITVLGVNYDGVSGEELATQAQKLGLKFASLEEDPSAQLGVPRPIVLPSTLIVNPDGEVVATLLGPQTLESLSEAAGQADETTP